MRLLVTRPEPDARRQAEALAAKGHQPVLAPLLTIEFLSDMPLDLAGAQALIVTSRNALRALSFHPQRREAIKLPLLAVGEATARAAAELGFTQVTTGPGTGEALAELIRRELGPNAGPLVHLAGETLAFDLKSALEMHGFAVRQAVLYRAVPVRELPPQALSLLTAGKLDGVILMSPRTAGTFADLLRMHGAVTELTGLRCYCLSPAVAEALAPHKPLLRVALRPREEDILALIDSEAASSG
jgi:uroporphyrinogen-III synthase